MKRILYLGLTIIVVIKSGFPVTVEDKHDQMIQENHEIVNQTPHKRDHHFGKIDPSIMDKVYKPDWRQGRLVYLPGVQASSYMVPVRLFMDKDYFQQHTVAQQLAAESQFQPIHQPTNDHSISGMLPAAKLLTLNNVPGILAVEPPDVSSLHEQFSPAPYVVKHSNPIPLERAGVPDAWKRWGKGKGVKIGVIDGGFITLPMLREADVLPKDKVTLRQVLPDTLAKQYPYGTGIHGAAVAEVIHEIAPEAELYLYPTLVIPELWGKAIQMAIEDGVDIISCSLNSTLGVLDGEGIPNKYIDRAIENGILYVNSAGNYGASTYVAPYIDPDQDGWHNFSASDEGNAIFLRKGDNLTVSLLWDDFGSNTELPNADQDLDLYLFYVDPKTHNLVEVANSESNQEGASDRVSLPAERLTLPSHGAPETGNYAIMIRAHRIDPNRILNMRLVAEAYDLNGSPPNIYKNLQYKSRDMTLSKPGDHPEVLTIAACGIDHNIHPYSGTGPTLTETQKPDLTGYSGLLTSSMQDPFLGTSCAAPFVAGCAALLWQQYPSADEVKKQVIARAITPPNSGIRGFDPSSGWGIVSLDEPDPSNPKGEIIAFSAVNTIINDDKTVGINCVGFFQVETARHDIIHFGVYFQKDGNLIKAGNDEALQVYKNRQGQLRVSNYVIPAFSRLSAFRTWLIIPKTVLHKAGDEAQIIVRLEDSHGHIMHEVNAGRVVAVFATGVSQPLSYSVEKP